MSELWFLVGFPLDGGKAHHLAGPESRQILERVMPGWVAHCAGWATVLLASATPVTAESERCRCNMPPGFHAYDCPARVKP